LTYHLRAPERGEVVVFHDPQDYSTYFIKRVIGLPNETIKISSNTVTVYNAEHPSSTGGLILNESYLPQGTITAGNESYTLSSTTYLMLGDNRLASFDSRSWGPLPAGNIVGLVRVRLWPPNAITLFSAPNYQ
jgi:signal peptidase I